MANLPAGAVTSAFRTAKDSAGQSEGASPTEWVVFRVTDVIEPTLDLASEDAKKLKTSVERGLADELVGQYVIKMENEIGVTINQPAVAQITGANN